MVAARHELPCLAHVLFTFTLQVHIGFQKSICCCLVTRDCSNHLVLRLRSVEFVSAWCCLIMIRKPTACMQAYAAAGCSTTCAWACAEEIYRSTVCMLHPTSLRCPKPSTLWCAVQFISLPVRIRILGFEALRRCDVGCGLHM